MKALIGDENKSADSFSSFTSRLFDRKLYLGIPSYTFEYLRIPSSIPSYTFVYLRIPSYTLESKGIRQPDDETHRNPIRVD